MSTHLPADPLLKILVAEDSADNYILLQFYLKKLNYQPEWAENGQLALQKVMQNSYDLILMDIEMPVMDGIEATKAIRQWEKEHQKQAVPIVALTAHQMAAEFEKIIEAGCNGYLSKPVERPALADAIAKYCLNKVS